MIFDYIRETREPTLLLSALAGLVGLSAAIYYGNASISIGILTIAGAILAQAAVNMIDDYVDFKSGLDKETDKTKFSGGSGLLISGRVKPSFVLIFALVLLVVAGIIGAYALINAAHVAFVVFLFIIVGGAGVLFYAKYLVRVPFFAEPFVALSFMLIGVGVFLVSSNSMMHILNVLAVCSLAGIQIGAVLITNEIPDINADRKYGRRSGIALSEGPARAWRLYVGFQVFGYVLLIASIVAGILPLTCLLVLLFIPAAFYIATGIISYKNAKAYEKIMKVSALVCMVYMLVLSAGYLLYLM